jgi:hypothetical protein
MAMLRDRTALVRAMDARLSDLDALVLPTTPIVAPTIAETSSSEGFTTRNALAKFGGHPPRGTPTDFFWSLHWVIPADYPTGSLVYKVVATDLDGRTQTWEPFKRAPTQLTVIAGEPTMKQ